MFLSKTNTTDLDTSNVTKAAKRAQQAGSAAAANAAKSAQSAATAAQHAATLAQTAAQSAASALSKNITDKVLTARKWAAPRLEDAADYTASTVAPKVSSALRNTARQVSPPEPEKPGHRMLTWTMLAAGIVAGLGAAAALVRYRFHEAIAADSETADEEVLADSVGGKAAPAVPDSTKAAAPKADADGSESSVNGRVKASGW